MKKLSALLRPLLQAALALSLISPAVAQETIKVGVLSQDTGPFAQNGRSFRQGIATYVALHGKQAGGRNIEFVFRDIGGPSPAVAKRLGEELLVREKVNMLAGFSLTSDALAVSSLIEKTKTPAVLFIASSPLVPKSSKYFLKTGQHTAQSASSAAVFARKHDKERAYIVVSDYAPGHDAQKAFGKTFQAQGGKIIGEARVPLSTVDFAAIVERIAQAEPDVVNVFVPPGAPAIGLMRALAERGLMKSAMVIGMGEAEDHMLPEYDDSVLGFYQSLYYAEALDNPENQAFVAKLKELFGPDTQPDFASASAYDGAHLLYQMVESQKGKSWDGPAAMEAVKGTSWNGVRGPMKIDPSTRELVQNIYLRKVEKVDGKLKNVVVDKIEAVQAPTDEWMAN
ncbi:ABC transporter substrate-binding protein [Pusillimonas noertemannii]|uniref:Branched-chain amino acid transport system substrate-binding protein n=1 Tax=Pusillimonas noertemannii TaxID=305977 RepID=A0A2U1CNW3_9BURK|nr:ABC transporter substrate-binding protein [Pusillimonas noertemannii]NYT68280.1 ABC transporter substrate-binding protein [Pusillimonas noertemannii]PVY62705.1 branched-chain amino acid transport system substrate-binding protein [Pusillimonas noertemannii]TFL10357.1 ABC transporter substrate-binding protein [Pusillimonas noertemannii]